MTRRNHTNIIISKTCCTKTLEKSLIIFTVDGLKIDAIYKMIYWALTKASKYLCWNILAINNTANHPKRKWSIDLFSLFF